MDTCRLQARDWLSQSTRKEFEAIISDTSVQTVERDLQQAYNSVKRALKAVT